MNFKIYEETVYVKEPQGLLRKSAQVKRWTKIGVGRSGNDYTVYAIDDFIDNELIEECPAIEVPIDEVKGTLIMDHTFKISEGLYALGWGNAALYKHRNQPNARWEYDAEKKLIRFASISPIKKGEEIFISYGREYFNTRNKNMKS
jgi:hypothetical protein